MDQNLSAKAVEDASKGIKNHNFSDVYKDIVQMEQQDKTAGPNKLHDDMKQLNDTLHKQGILNHCEIVGSSDGNKLLTKCGSQEKKQDASNFQDSDGDHHEGFGSIMHTFKDIKDTVTHSIESAATPVIDAINKVSLPAAVDAIAGTHLAKVATDLEKGAVHEVLNHPVKVGLIAAGSAVAAVGIAAVGLEGAAAVAAGVAVTAVPLAGIEIARNGGGKVLGQAGSDLLQAGNDLVHNRSKFGDDLSRSGSDLWQGSKDVSKGIVRDAKSFGNTVKDWGKDIGIVGGTDKHSAEEEAKAEKGLQQAGAFVADTGAGIAGGYAGGVTAAARGWQGALRNTPAEELAVVPKPVVQVEEKPISKFEEHRLKQLQDLREKNEKFDDPKYKRDVEAMASDLRNGHDFEAAKKLLKAMTGPSASSEKTLAMIDDMHKLAPWRLSDIEVSNEGVVFFNYKGTNFKTEIGKIEGYDPKMPDWTDKLNDMTPSELYEDHT